MLNKVQLIGRLGQDPEIKYLPTGMAICSISLATSENKKDKQGNKTIETEWHSIILFDKQAEIANEYLKKGSLVYIDGKIKTKKWEDKNTGQDRYKTEIICNEFKMLGDRQEDNKDDKVKKAIKESFDKNKKDDFMDNIPF